MRHLRILPALLLATLAGEAAAQTADTASAVVRGTVHDSLAGRPIAGAMVQMARHAGDAAGDVYSATTDSAGAFRIAGVPRGEYLATFYDDRLDELGLVAGVRVLRVDGDATIDFGVPGARTLRALLCHRSASADSSAVIVGRLFAVDRAAPVAGATVTAQWFELSLGSRGLVRSMPTARATTDEMGRFLLCGLPGDASVDLRAESGRAATGIVRVDLPPFAVAPTTLAIDVADTIAAEGPRRGTARVSGFVRLPDGKAVAGARVSLRETDRETVTDETGHYALVDLPAGTFSLETRAIGFIPVARMVTLSASNPLSFDVRLDSAAQILETVDVRGKVVYDRAMEQFEKERRRGLGWFLGPEEIERRHAWDASELLRTVPGVRVMPTRFGSARAVTLRDCVPTIVVDGMRFVGGVNLDEVVSGSEVRAIAVYRSAAETPAEYIGGGGCGAIVVWTKIGAPRRRR